MHAAGSIVAFTTASGAGYGILALLAAMALTGTIPPDPALAWPAFGAGFALVTSGLLASTLHLGHPERAWRALGQWRSSWLSREAVLALAGYPPALAFAFGWLSSGGAEGPYALAAWLTLLTTAGTVVCTGMIYASLATVQEWRHPLVVPIYLALALMTGAFWLVALMALTGHDLGLLLPVATATTVVAYLMKLAYWRGIDRSPRASTPESATGLGDLGRVRLLDPPHTESNFLLQEMGFKLARRHRDTLRLIAKGAGFVAPAVLALLAAIASPTLAAAALTVATLSASLGVVVERWLFFAEAKHTVMLYYGGHTESNVRG
jgi:DMSO reductase anchor subunit